MAGRFDWLAGGGLTLITDNLALGLGVPEGDGGEVIRLEMMPDWAGLHVRMLAFISSKAFWVNNDRNRDINTTHCQK